MLKKGTEMKICISKIRIKNFRSIESLELDVMMNNVLIGQNNCGKSNLLKAINVGVNSNYSVSSSDIFVESGESLSLTKESIIDLMFVPLDENGKRTTSFSDFWTGVFSTNWISSDATEGDFVGIRTIISYDPQQDDYKVSKKAIRQWGESVTEATCGRKQGYTADMQKYIYSFYMDAHRDILEDLRNKRSYFGRATSSKGMSEDKIRELESKLNEINEEIVSNTPALKNTETQMAAIGHIIGSTGSKLQIEPISRKISDLHKGMDVKFKDGESASIPISDHGMGTRSWISFLTLGAYVNYIQQCSREEAPDAEVFVVLTMEEPEAHLHSCAQKKLYKQINSFSGQKFVSTHSSGIVSQVNIEELIHLYKIKGKTIVHRINSERYNTEDIAKIQREFIRSKGDLLFSSGIVLAEGITEEIALPIYFQRYFDADPNSMGISIIGIGGQNYRSFLNLVSDFDIPCYIFSDGEPSTVKTVKNAVLAAWGKNLEDAENVIVLDNGEDYEDHLINSGYQDAMIAAINEYEATLRQETDPEGAERDPYEFFERYIQEHHNEQCGKRKTEDICSECGRPKEEVLTRNYIGEDGIRRALIDCCQRSGHKAKYAECIAVKIAASSIPPKVKDLFDQINDEMHLIIRTEDANED